MSANAQKKPPATVVTLLITLLSSLLLACSSQQTINSFNPEPAPSDQAAVYVYRPLSTTNAIYSPDLYVDGEFKYSIKNTRKTRILVPAGVTVFELAPDKKYSGITSLSLTLEAAKTYYLRVDTSLQLKPSTTYQPYERSFSLVSVTAEQAIDEIGRCCHTGSNDSVASESEDAASSPQQTDKADTGFSVDKTQNPFSH